MSEIIMRISDKSSDAEILTHDEINKRDYFSVMALSDIIERLETFIESREKDIRRGNITLFDDELIGVGPNAVVVKQSEHKRIVTYQNKAYNIIFPNSIYIINHRANRISDIEAYCYKKFVGADTELFKYAMPNMLTANRICMGSAPKTIEQNDFVAALEKIIFTQYTHSHTDNIKSFKETKTYFEYLEHNDFPYDLLIPTNQTLKIVIK